MCSTPTFFVETTKPHAMPSAISAKWRTWSRCSGFIRQPRPKTCNGGAGGSPARRGKGGRAGTPVGTLSPPCVPHHPFVPVGLSTFGWLQTWLEGLEFDHFPSHCRECIFPGLCIIKT